MEDKITLIVTALPNPNNMESVQQYLKEVMPIFNEAGGKLVKRVKVDEVIYGNPSGMVLVMDFDSEKVIKSLFESEPYAALIPIRDKGFKEMNILIAHGM